MAHYVGLVQPPGGLGAGRGAPGGGLAGPGSDDGVVVVRGVPEVYFEGLGVQNEARAVGPLVHDATGCQLRAPLG